ncbi:Set1 complex component spp1 [Fusarium oxysporum f. sp. albedinis]|nr:Set1 complex component spp1 [Fusarium oxysporum f. sp. albedinis]
MLRTQAKGDRPHLFLGPPFTFLQNQLHSPLSFFSTIHYSRSLYSHFTLIRSFVLERHPPPRPLHHAPAHTRLQAREIPRYPLQSIQSIPHHLANRPWANSGCPSATRRAVPF